MCSRLTKLLLVAILGGSVLPAFAANKEQIAKEIQILKQHPVVALDDNQRFAQLTAQIDTIANYPYQEAMDALVYRLAIECAALKERYDQLSPNEIDTNNWFEKLEPKLIMHILIALKANGSAVHLKRAIETLSLLDELTTPEDLLKKNIDALKENLTAEIAHKNSLPHLDSTTSFRAKEKSTLRAQHTVLMEITTFRELPASPDRQGLQYQAVMDIASHLSKFEFYEPIDAIVDRLELEAQTIFLRYKNLKNGVINNWLDQLQPEILFHLLDVLRTSATTNYLSRVQKILLPLEEIYQKSEPLEQKIRQEYLELEAALKGRKMPLPSIYKAINDLPPGIGGLPQTIFDGPAHSLAARMKKAREGVTEYLKKYVVGQDEAIKAFADLEEQNVIFPERDTPHKIMLAGLPALGKDTLVQGYVDYLNHQHGAWRQDLHKAPVMKDHSDVWRFLGSAAGYVDSDNIPPLLTFLVNHSNGRYRMETREDGQGRIKWKILENINADLIEAARNNGIMKPPYKGVILFNEFHNWTQEMKDELKIAMEHGEWTINNPGGGLDRIYVPVDLIFCTNEGSALVSSMEPTGERFGAPLSAEKMQEKWAGVYRDRDRLITELMRSNSRKSTNGSYLGYSREWLNRFEGSPIILLRPFGPDELQTIAGLGINFLADDYKYNSEAKNISIVATPELLQFLQAHNYRSEEMARPVIGKIDQMIQLTINKALREDLIPLNQKVQVFLTPLTNVDRTTDLEFRVLDKDGREIKKLRLLIDGTLGDKEKPVMPPERIDYLLKLASFLNANVFGLHPILVNGITNSILLAEEAKYGRQSPDNEAEKEHEGANIFGLFGKSSTGKTETIKVVNKYLYGNREPVTIDFSQVQNIDDIKALILGSRNVLGENQDSKFMKYYDRMNGELLIAFDEIANAPAWALKALYDIFREPVVTTFVDNKPRPMNKVTIMLTGNVGEEWYKSIPKNLPEWIQMYAMQEIYLQALNNPAARRTILEKYFSEALINRINEQNIFFYGPLTFKSLRELTQLKMMLLLDELKPKEGRYGWDIRFANLDAFYDIVKMVEENGFVLAEQGASIENFVNKMLKREIRILLIKNKIVPGSTVILTRLSQKESVVEEGGQKRPKLVLGLQAGEQKFELEVFGRPIQKEEVERDEDRYLTSLHEASHAIASLVLFKGVVKQNKVSVIPGVTMIDDHYVAYAGIATHEEARKMNITLEWVLRQMAVLSAGEAGQRLATKGHIHDAGKGNDMERATDMAMRAILYWGLNNRWGVMTVPKEMSAPEYISSLSTDRRNMLTEEVDKMVHAARNLATTTIAANMDLAVIPLAQALAENGVLEGDAYHSLLAGLKLQYDDQGKFKLSANTVNKWITGQPGQHTIDAELVDYLPRPKTIAKYEEIVAKERAAAQAQVPAPEHLPLANTTYSAMSNILIKSLSPGCDSLLVH